MNFEGATPIKIPRYGSKCQWDDSVQLPLGLADIVRNGRYTAQSAATRYGHSTRLKVAQNVPVNSLGLLRYLAAQPGTLNLQAVETILLMMYTNDGNISSAAPFIQPSLDILTNSTFFSQSGIPNFPSLNPVIRQAFNKSIFAMGDLLLPKAPVLIYDPSSSGLWPASDIQFGAPWTPGTIYRVGHVVSPSSFETFGQTNGQGTWVEQQTGYLYQCIQAGTSGANPPTWPESYDGQVADGGVKWQECTPIYLSGLPDPAAPTIIATPTDGASPIVAGATVFIALTWLNSIGEGINAIVTTQGVVDTTKVLVWTNNTGAAVDVQIQLPNVPPYLATSGPLGPTYGAVNLNVYAFIETSTDAATIASQSVDPSFYALANPAPLTPGTTFTLNSFPNAQQLPQTSSAPTTAAVGNVDTGIRYMTTFFELQTGYQTGFSNSAPVPVNVTQSGWPITALRIPTGPYNCRARVSASTVAGASAAGPYTYISQADIESPGFNQPNVQITATRVEDNTTTTATFNFTDTYLPGATDVTSYFDRELIPPSVDVYFSKTLQRVIYTGAVGYQSGHIVSDIFPNRDAEAIRIPQSVLQVAPSDGDRCVCFRDVRGLPLSFKENSGHAVETNAGDPNTWGARQRWEGNGPCGPKAIAIAGQDNSEFAVWAHRSGLYLYAGESPSLISRELTQDWETINWDYGHLIAVRIDHDLRLIHILAPTNGATTCNARWILNYFFGMGDPVVFVQRRGILVPNVEGRKWSLDDFSGFNFIDAVYMPQKSANSVQVAGVDIEKEMIFAASDGSLKTITVGQYHDQDFNGAALGYHSEWRGVLGESPTSSFKQCLGGKFLATGNGLANLNAYDDQGICNPITGPLSVFFLAPGKRTRADLPAADHTRLSQHWAFGIDNGGVIDAWWEIFMSDLYVLETWDSLPG
jgi:hypothetical protein